MYAEESITAVETQQDVHSHSLHNNGDDEDKKVVGNRDEDPTTQHDVETKKEVNWLSINGHRRTETRYGNVKHYR